MLCIQILKNRTFATHNQNRSINILFARYMNAMIISIINNNIVYLFL